MKILGFDTAAKTASVALTDGGRLVSEFYLDSGFTHSETVLPMAKALLDNARIKPEDIDVFHRTPYRNCRREGHGDEP